MMCTHALYKWSVYNKTLTRYLFRWHKVDISHKWVRFFNDAFGPFGLGAYGLLVSISGPSCRILDCQPHMTYQEQWYTWTFNGNNQHISLFLVILVGVREDWTTEPSPITALVTLYVLVFYKWFSCLSIYSWYIF